MSTKSFHDELAYLRLLGAEYAQRHPTTAGALGAGARDPDVERLLQGFAFLTARLHDRLDNQFAHVAEGLLEVLWPQILRPMPSCTMIQFLPDREVLRKNHRVDRGVELYSAPQKWGHFTFQTAHTVDIYPFQIKNIELVEHYDSSLLEITFSINPGGSIQQSRLESLPIYICSDDPRFAYGWYMWLTQHVKAARLLSDDRSRQADVQIMPQGLDDDLPLLPGKEVELPGHRLLREFIAYPQNFLFVTVPQIRALMDLGVESQFTLQIDFGTRAPVGPMRKMLPGSFRLYCTPAINLFRSTARVALDHTRSEFVVRADDIGVEHHEVYGIERVTGVENGPSGRQHEFVPAYGRRRSSGIKSPLYRIRFDEIQVSRDDRPLQGLECFIAFDSVRTDTPHSVSLEITCCNRGGASSLKPGDICKRSEMVPPFLEFVNLDPPSPYRPAAVQPDYVWQIISSLNLARQSVGNLRNLRSVVAMHSRPDESSEATVNQWLDGLRDLSVQPSICTENGAVLRTVNVNLRLGCPSERVSEFYLFGVILCEYMRHIASINTRLRCRIQFGDDPTTGLEWPMRRGSCPAL